MKESLCIAIAYLYISVVSSRGLGFRVPLIKVGGDQAANRANVTDLEISSHGALQLCFRRRKYVVQCW